MTFLPHDIFAQIISGEISAEVVYEDEISMAFRDINPKANTHIVIIPKKNFVTAQEVTEKNEKIFGHLFLAAKKVAEKLHLEGYKLHMNVGEKGGQVVPHVHLHLLSPDYQTNL